MIALTRTRTTAAIPASLRGASRRTREHELLHFWRDHLASGGTKSPKWKTTYWKAGKRRLKNDSAGKCAYCESPTDVVAHGDVEHFRPKTTYWWLAYCFDNHLFACQICNQSYKLDNFPIAGTAMPGPPVSAASVDADLDVLVDGFAPDPFDVLNGYTSTAFGTATRAEGAALPDPYNEDPEPYFKWEADEVNKEVWLRPRQPNGREFAAADACERFLGLNREELRRWRWKLAYKQLAALRGILDTLVARDPGDLAIPVVQGHIRDMMQADQVYAGMVRFFVVEAWRLNV